MSWLWIVLSFIGGSVFGVVSMCCFIIAGREERALERRNKEDADYE